MGTQTIYETKLCGLNSFMKNNNHTRPERTKYQTGFSIYRNLTFCLHTIFFTISCVYVFSCIHIVLLIFQYL